MPFPITPVPTRSQITPGNTARPRRKATAPAQTSTSPCTQASTVASTTPPVTSLTLRPIPIDSYLRGPFPSYISVDKSPSNYQLKRDYVNNTITALKGDDSILTPIEKKERLEDLYNALIGTTKTPTTRPTGNLSGQIWDEIQTYSINPITGLARRQATAPPAPPVMAPIPTQGLAIESYISGPFPAYIQAKTTSQEHYDQKKAFVNLVIQATKGKHLDTSDKATILARLYTKLMDSRVPKTKPSGALSGKLWTAIMTCDQ